MQLVNLEEVEVGERQRSEMSEAALRDLVDSLRSYGLIHPPVVRRAGGGWRLVCGHRRLEALRRLAGTELRGPGLTFTPPIIPVLVLGEDVTDEDAFLLEFEENERREALSWQDRVRALAKIAEILGVNEGAEALASASGMETVSAASRLREAVRVARRLDDPRVAGASSIRSALRVVKEIEDAETASVVAAAPEVLEGDCRSILPTLPRESFHCIIWDPPYGIGAHEFADGRAANPSPHHYEDDPESALALFRETVPLLTPLAAPGAHLWLFCDIRHLPVLRAGLEETGWRVRGAPLVWRKAGGQAGRRVPDPGRPIRRVYEVVLFAWRPGADRAFGILEDVLDAPAPRNPFNKAEKPVELLRQLVSFSLGPGERLLDPMCGSGNSLVAALQRGAEPLGIEQDPVLVAEARRRVEAARSEGV